MVAVASIEKRKRILTAGKDKDGNPIYDYEDLGKWAILAPPFNLAFPCDAMELEVGDEVDVILRKKEATGDAAIQD